MSEDRATAIAVIAAVEGPWGQDRMIDRMDRREIDDLAERITTLTSEHEAIGRAAGREEAAKVAEAEAETSVPLMKGLGVAASVESGRYRAGIKIAAAIRALPVDGGKDRP